MALDDIIFDDKTLADMFSDVYKNVGSKRDQINNFLAKIVPLIRTPEDVAVLGPVIKDFFEANIKNDEHIVRLVQIAQRITSVNAKGGDMMGLSEEEKDQLMKNLEKEFQTLSNEQDDLEDTISSLKK